MWNSDDEMQVFKALSYWDKVRVSRCLARGEAPKDRRRADAAIELAESLSRQRPLPSKWRRVRRGDSPF
jgi:hypothetical protein